MDRVQDYEWRISFAIVLMDAYLQLLMTMGLISQWPTVTEKAMFYFAGRMKFGYVQDVNEFIQSC